MPDLSPEELAALLNPPTTENDDPVVENIPDPDKTTLHSINGKMIALTDAQYADYHEKLAAVNALINGRNVGDIPLGDIYYSERKKFDEYVSTLD